MTSQKERASRSSFWGPCSVWTKPSYKVSVYIWTHLIEGLHWVYTFGASPVAAAQIYTSSVLNSALEDPESHFALLAVWHNLQAWNIKQEFRSCMCSRDERKRFWGKKIWGGHKIGGIGVHILHIHGDLFPNIMRKSRQIYDNLFPKFMRTSRHLWIIWI